MQLAPFRHVYLLHLPAGTIEQLTASSANQPRPGHVI